MVGSIDTVTGVGATVAVLVVSGLAAWMMRDELGDGAMDLVRWWRAAKHRALVAGGRVRPAGSHVTTRRPRPARPPLPCTRPYDWSSDPAEQSAGDPYDARLRLEAVEFRSEQRRAGHPMFGNHAVSPEERARFDSIVEQLRKERTDG